MKLLSYLLLIGFLAACHAVDTSSSSDADADTNTGGGDTSESANSAADEAALDVFPVVSLSQLQDLVGGDIVDLEYELGVPHADFVDGSITQQIYVYTAESLDDSTTFGDVSCEVSLEFDEYEIIVDYAYTGEGCDALIDFSETEEG